MNDWSVFVFLPILPPRHPLLRFYVTNFTSCFKNPTFSCTFHRVQFVERATIRKCSNGVT